MSLPVEYTTQWVPAWRWFAFTWHDRPLALQAPFQDEALDSNEAVATCRYQHPDRVPAEGCRCGFHAHASQLGAFCYWFEPGAAFAQVELSGEILAHGEHEDDLEGYRAEKMRVLGITINAACGLCGAPAVGYERYEDGLFGRCSACAEQHAVDLLSRSDIAGALGIEVGIADLVKLQEEAVLSFAAPGVAAVHRRLAAHRRSVTDLEVLWTKDPASLGTWLADLLTLGVKLPVAWRLLTHQPLPELSPTMARAIDILQIRDWRGLSTKSIDDRWRADCTRGLDWDQQVQTLRQDAVRQGITASRFVEMLRTAPEALSPWLSPCVRKGLWPHDAWQLITGEPFPAESTAEQYRLRGIAHTMLCTIRLTWEQAVDQYRQAEQLAADLRTRAAAQGLDATAFQQMCTRPAGLAEWLAPLVVLVLDEPAVWYLLTGEEVVSVWPAVTTAVHAARLHDDPVWAWRTVASQEPLSLDDYTQLQAAAACLSPEQVAQAHDQAAARWGSTSVLREALVSSDRGAVAVETARLLPVLASRRDLRVHWEVFCALHTAEHPALQCCRDDVVQLYCALIEGYQVALAKTNPIYWVVVAREGHGVWMSSLSCVQL